MLNMCTSLKYKNCMGRNFDYEISYEEKPRIYKKEQYKIFGIVANIIKDYPLYYDAMNEHGLCIAGLNFESNAYYYEEEKPEMNNLAPWELPVKILGNCKDVQETKEYLKNVRIINKPFNKEMPNSSLHWFICDKNNSITIEQTEENGLQVYDNKNDVLTNNPPLPDQEKYYEEDNTRKYLDKPLKTILPKKYKTRGLETYGILGDLTSMSRYQRVVYYKNKLLNSINNFDPVIQTFYLLDNVRQIFGATPVNKKFEYTIYEVVYDMNKLQMYLKTYTNMIPTIIDLDKEVILQ